MITIEVGRHSKRGENLNSREAALTWVATWLGVDALATTPAPAANPVRAAQLKAIRERRADGYEKVVALKGTAGAMLQMLADINYLWSLVPTPGVGEISY